MKELCKIIKSTIEYLFLYILGLISITISLVFVGLILSIPVVVIDVVVHWVNSILW